MPYQPNLSLDIERGGEVTKKDGVRDKRTQG